MEIAQHGYGHIAVQVDGSNNSVTVSCGQARLTLLQRHKRRRVPRKHLDLLDPYSRAIELVGRADDLGALQAWLATDLPIAVCCLTGRAGSGKTRLAIELCEWAEGQGWLAGFVAYDELAAFHQRQHLADWRWPKPMLVVVDYAAASARVLRHWLEQLAEHQAGGAPRLRLLLLERHASAEAGWWAELTRFGGFGSAGLEDLLDPPLPVVLPSLRTVEQRRQVLGSVMAAASALDGTNPPLQPPAPGFDPLFDARLADDLIDNEPLYLMMAGLTAVQARVPHLLAIGRNDLARRLAEAEIERIGRVARDRGLDSPFLQHLAACVTLTDGIARAFAEALALDEREALQLPALDATAFAMALADALGGVADGIEAIRPDLIGEAVILTAFARAGRSPDRQAAIVERAWRRASAKTLATLVRAAQDFAPANGRHATLDWLRHLAGQAHDPFELMRIVGEIPAATLSMGELAAEIQSKVVELSDAEAADEPDRNWRAVSLHNLANRLSDLGRREAALAAAEEAAQLYRELAAARPDAFRPNLAVSLNNLASRLSDLGRREAALAAAEEAAQLYRELAAARPDAFRPNLAVSLAVVANCLEANDRVGEALAADREAIEALSEPFLTVPEAFAHWMVPMVGHYLNRCQAQGSEPDAGLLEPLLPAVMAFVERSDHPTGKGETT